LRNLSKLSSVVVVEKVKASLDLVKSLFEKACLKNKLSKTKFCGCNKEVQKQGKEI
jgi:hypothetical protein